MRSLRAATALSAFCLLAPAGAAAASNGGVAFAPPVVQPAPPVQPVAPAPSGKLVGFIAHAPHGAPVAVRRVIAAGNSLQTFPYRYGGGHAAFKDKAYDCSGTVSF